MSLTFVVGRAGDVFGPALADAVDAALRGRFPSLTLRDGDPYHSEPVEFAGWRDLARRAPLLVEPYQAVFVPVDVAAVETLVIPNAADPLQVASLSQLLAALHAFAESAALPTDDVELMTLAAKYLEDDLLISDDLDVQTYVQLMLSAKQAAATGRALWVVA
ncbi:MAG TPA: hypothetical protein VJZ76_05680 [Thermoanaerobaculia bacterium]|nr:hypothetical protein [Thermoanaerobaculia bacterium]